MKGEHEGEEFLGLAGGGMDLSPKFIAYQALAFGCIDPDLVRKFRECGPDYCRMVMGRALFDEVTKILGIYEFMDATEEQLKASMKAFDSKLKQISKARKKGKLGEVEAGLLAMIALTSVDK